MSTDLHLMHHICNVIENLERKNLEPKLDKKALFVDIVKQLFTDLNTDQLSFLDNFADFICASSLVAKVSTMQKVHQLVKKFWFQCNKFTGKAKTTVIVSTNKKVLRSSRL